MGWLYFHIYRLNKQIILNPTRTGGATKRGLTYRVSKEMPHFGFCLIFLAGNILEGWYIFHLRGKIHRSVLSTKTFLCNIREPRYKKKNMGYHISKLLTIGQSSVLKTDAQYYFPYILAIPCCTELCWNLKHAIGVTFRIRYYVPAFTNAQS